MLPIGYNHSKETKQKISLTLKGHPVSEETRKKLRLANLGKHNTEETKQKMSDNAKINPNFGMKNKHHSEESRQKMSLANLGKHHSEETKLKIGLISKGNKSNLGHHQSEEHKRKISLSNKGHLVSEETKQIIRQKVKEWRKTQLIHKKDTSIELKIQEFLKQLGMEFFTHKYININHGYQCDILIPFFNIVIECDGNYWHKYPIGRDIDHIRTKELIEKGFKVLRLWEFEIKKMGIDDFEYKLKEYGVENGKKKKK